MEPAVAKKDRAFRNQEHILSVLDEYKKSKLSIKAFCIEKDIASATFHNWKKKYNNHKLQPGKPKGFASLRITPSVGVSVPVIFAEVRGIKIYQPVTACYLKELLS